MHKDDVIIQVFPGTIDAIDIVCLSIQRVVDEREVHRKAKEIAIIDKDLVKISRSHYDIGDTKAQKKL